MRKRFKQNLFLGLAIIIYLISRSTNLLALPIFNDELLYLDIAKKLVANPSEFWFVSFTDGKEPLFFWLLALFVKIIPDPLLAGRSLSVATGLIGLIFFNLLAQRIFQPLVVMVVSLLFLFSPFIFFYQRLTLLDALVTTVYIVFLFCLQSQLAKPTWRSALAVGLTGGLMVMTKSTGWLLLLSAIPIIVLTVTNYSPSLLKKFIFSVSLGGMLYAFVALQPEYAQIAAKNGTFVASVAELINQPFSYLLVNLKQAGRWLFEYQGFPFIVALGLGAVFIVSQRKKSAIGWLLAAVLPLFITCLVGKIFFPRYMLPEIIPLLILVGIFLQHLGAKKAMLVAGSILFFNIILTFQIITDVKTASLPFSERYQYVLSWSAGYGLKETADYLTARGVKTIVTEKIVTTSLGFPYFMPVGNKVAVKSYDFDQRPPNFSHTGGTYYVFSRLQSVPSFWPLKHEATFFRPAGERIAVYSIDQQ